MILSRRTFDNRNDLASGLAHRVAQSLSKSVSHRGSAFLAVSGGTTPALFLQTLSQAEISWDKVIVTLVDERAVPEDSPRSNAKLVRQHLLQNKAAAATFEPLYNNPAAARMGRFAAVVLGMGSDGHTASFFPGGDTLAAALDMQAKPSIVTLNAPGAGETRLTFNLVALAATDFLALHVEGREKFDVLEKAISGGDAFGMPVRAVLHLATPLHIYWCP